MSNFSSVLPRAYSDITQASSQASPDPVPSLSTEVKETHPTNFDELTTNSSYSDMWNVIATSMSSIKNDHVDMYANLMQKYIDMYDAYNQHIQKALSDAVSEGSDANHVKFDNSKMYNGYKNFIENAFSIDCGSVPHWSDMSADARDNMKNSLRPAFKVSDHGTIMIDFDNFKAVARRYPGGEGDFEADSTFAHDKESDLISYGEWHDTHGTSSSNPKDDYLHFLAYQYFTSGARNTEKLSSVNISTTKNQAFLASTNTVGNAIQSNMNILAQRLSQQNGTYDNLVKVLSGFISSTTESLQLIIKAL